jgi:hypothetical protein
VLKISALAVLAAVLVAVASPASSHRRHNAVAHRGYYNSAVVVDPNGFNAFGQTPSGLLYDPVRNGSYNPALNGGGSAGYNAEEKIH